MRRRNRQAPGLRILLGLLLLAGLAFGGWWWWHGRQTVQRPITQYFTDTQAMFLVPVSRFEQLPSSEAEALERVLEGLTSPPAGLQPTLPLGTNAEVQSISNGQANVQIAVPSSMGSGAERLLVGAVVRTAASLGSVREVRLQMKDRQGTPYESQHVDLSAPLTPTDPGIENLYLDGGMDGLTVTLYYATRDGRYLVPLRRPLPPQYGAQPLEGSFQLLVAGPPPELADSLSPSVPSHPGIGWGGVDQGVARIQWAADQPPPSESALRAFALTLTEFDGVRQVSITQHDQEIANSQRPAAVNPATGSVYPAP